MVEIDDAVLQSLYIWVDKIPLSRVKRNIARDFSDGTLMAEVMKHFFPKFVNLHNYPACNSTAAKHENWQLLNWKVFKKLNFELSDDVIDSLVAAKPGTIEKVLLLLKTKIDHMVADERGRSYDWRPESEQYSGNNSPIPRASTPKNWSRGGYPPRDFQTTSQKLSPTSVRPGNFCSEDMHSEPTYKHMCHGKSHNTGLKFSSSDFISRVLYEDKVQECLALEETVEILNAKVRRLEHLLRLKDSRIEELQKITGGGFRGKNMG
ncbi:Sperm flagellar protein 1 [Clonorchis sinensis]|uniref:Sperm flagellar protein 1 n=2 Tax=Clonorchis sinensis TaxID=79923 RepID=A0A8T1M5S7_CLOSI|nr:Sperm flagellar protein 1 [Clonorchis sinensis]GAA37561.1 sperm flagellar protein 1 [Clonorchis sinensis]